MGVPESGTVRRRPMQNARAVAARLTEPWKPVVVGEANGFLMKVVRLEGVFPWHAHEREDEMFFCLQGSFRIEQDWAPHVELSEGDVFTVPAGRRHRPVAAQPAVAILFERSETKQYGG
jgi:mannose-6-phosphate isomerase-like protein (cupin superfamily)